MTDGTVLVIGAGQAGLAAGLHLRDAGIAFTIVDAADRVGDSWRRRFDSLTLFTPRGFSRLPGLDLPGDPDAYPTKDEFADYLERYAEAFRLPVRTGGRVVQLQKEGGHFAATFDDGSVRRMEKVIVATGGFQKPFVPVVAACFGPGVTQLTLDDYRNPGDLPAGPVLVVGDGASGRDVAVECAGRGRVLLATGKPRKLLPERLLGRSIWWWLAASGVLKAGPDSAMGRLLRKADAFPNRGRSLAALAFSGVEIVPRLVGADGTAAKFSDGRAIDVRTVIWAVGYREDNSWMRIPGATDTNGVVIHDRGVSPVDGLYFVGRPWQRNRASALVMGAGPDARAVVEGIVQKPEAPRSRPPLDPGPSRDESGLRHIRCDP